MGVLAPRVVIVRRETEFERVRAVYATAASARFVLERKGLKLEAIEAAHAEFAAALRHARAAIPSDWRQSIIMRDEIAGFVFGQIGRAHV